MDKTSEPINWDTNPPPHDTGTTVCSWTLNQSQTLCLHVDVKTVRAETNDYWFNHQLFSSLISIDRLFFEISSELFSRLTRQILIWKTHKDNVDLWNTQGVNFIRFHHIWTPDTF